VKTDKILLYALDSLSVFGENTKMSIMKHLTSEGISFSPESFDILRFCNILNQLLASGSDIVFNNICSKICEEENIPIDKVKNQEETQPMELLLKLVVTL
jgi:hypothetical protein